MTLSNNVDYYNHCFKNNLTWNSTDKILEHWSELDEFEGEAYERVLTTVELQNKSIVDAFIYTLKRANNSYSKCP